MKINNFAKKSNLILLLQRSIVVVIFFHLSLLAQQSDFHISYCGKISSENFKNDNSYIGLISNLIFGKPETNLIRPVNLLVKNDEFWILDQGQNAVLNFNREKETFYATSCENFNLSSVVSISMAESKLVFTDSRLNTVFIYDSEENQTALLNTNYAFNRPTGIAYNTLSKDIWVTETGAHHLVLINSKGVLKKVIGERGMESGQFNFPGFIWIDKDGFAYVVDAMNFRVQIFDAEGNFLSMFGEAGDASGYLARPKGIATDSYGNIYVADALFNTVQIFDRDGNYLYNFGKKGSGESEFMLPMGIFIDTSDQIYVADSFNKRVQIFRITRD